MKHLQGIRAAGIIWRILMLCLLPGTQVLAQLTANFQSSASQGCAPLLVSFQDQSTGNPTSWLWDFGNGNTSTERNPSAIYPGSGTYTVRLTVQNGAQIHSITRTAYVNVYEKPTVGGSANVAQVCLGQPFLFTDQSVLAPGGSPLVKWEWDMGNGVVRTGRQVTYAYPSAGAYSVILTVEDANGCRQGASLPGVLQVTGATPPAFTATPAFGCNAPHTVTFTNQTPGMGGLQFAWDFGDGTTSTSANPGPHTYTEPGNYTVRLISIRGTGCRDTLVKPRYIQILGSTADSIVTPAVSPCAGSQAALSVPQNDAIASVTWDFGDGFSGVDNPAAHTYRSAGTYRVTADVRYVNGCSLRLEKDLRIVKKPRALFSASPQIDCREPLDATFMPADTTFDSYLWTLPDGRTSTEKVPTFTFDGPGPYSVGLVTRNGSCMADTHISVIYPTQLNMAADITSKCRVPLTVTFSAGINDPRDTLDLVFWEFGDGITSQQRSPSHEYQNYGSYVAKLTVRTRKGCVLTDSRSVVVSMPAQAAFRIRNRSICASDTILLENYSVQHIVQIRVGNSEIPIPGGSGGEDLTRIPANTLTEAGR
ncbi:MAG: PKD domain-containing protein, partial [Bacteroidetes bacterium]|nr:PKD domain-containing protein [Bacteroidota bacterium]